MRFQWQESRGCAPSARDMLLAQRQVLDDADMVDAKPAFACQQKKEYFVGSSNPKNFNELSP